MEPWWNIYLPDNQREAFEKDAHPLTFWAIFMEKWKGEHVLWDSETVLYEIEQEWGLPASEQARDTIHALILCQSSQVPWRYPNSFALVSQAFNHGVVDFSVLYNPSPGEILFTLRVMKKIDEKQEIQGGVWQQIAGWCWMQGLYWLGEELQPADVYLENLARSAGGVKARIEIAGQYGQWSNTPIDQLDPDDDNLVHIGALKMRLEKEYAEDMEKTRIHINL